MLNAETKRHIDAARDVLVGVAPNPMTQVDQITYALIYKFMDDMDQSAVKLGGEPSFFVGDLEPFAYSKLMDSRLGNQERMNLYGEALTKFAEAKQLPELFRTIFRAAFLPYRSPETLGLFLKEINFFDYTHPEELGNAYEYLLSIMSAQGDAGQFRTPRHIIDFMVEVLNPTKQEQVLDPACGTGGFLVSSYNHILEQHDGLGDLEDSKKPLTPDERRKLMDNFVGYDIDPSMVRIAQVNMYLHLFKNPKIFQYDSLTSEDRWNDKFDVILANPPFMTPKGGIKPNSKFGLTSNRSEVLFVEYISSHLKPNGRAGIIVPEGVIFQSGKAYKELRKNLVESGLYAVVSLPSGVFNPYSGVKTSILLIDKSLSENRDRILFIDIRNDGYHLGSTKREVEANDIPQALEILKLWKNNESRESEISTYATKQEISANGEYNLSASRYFRQEDYGNSNWPIVKLGDVVDSIKNGLTYSNDPASGGVPISRIQTISQGTIDFDSVGYAGIFEDLPKYKLADGDILFSHINSIDHLGKTAIYTSRMAPLLHGMNLLRVVSNGSQIRPEYLLYILRSKEFLNQVRSFAKKAINQASISIADLKMIEIPLPELKVQDQLISELKRFSSLVEGAKQIVESWRPHIEVDSSWPSYKLGELVSIDRNQGMQQQLPYIGLEDIEPNTGRFLGSRQVKEVRSATFRFDSRHVLYGKLRPYLNKYFVPDFEGHCSTELQPLLPSVALNRQFLAAWLSMNCSAINETSFGARMPRARLEQVLEMEIAVPDLEVQNKIAQKIEAERNQIEALEALIDNHKIRTSTELSKLWSSV